MTRGVTIDRVDKGDHDGQDEHEISRCTGTGWTRGVMMDRADKTDHDGQVDKRGHDGQADKRGYDR